MSEANRQSVTYEVCEQELKVRVSPDEKARLDQAMAMIQSVWTEIQKLHPYDKQQAMAMTIFQLAVELTEARESLRGVSQGEERLGNLIERIRTVTNTGS